APDQAPATPGRTRLCGRVPVLRARGRDHRLRDPHRWWREDARVACRATRRACPRQRPGVPRSTAGASPRGPRLELERLAKLIMDWLGGLYISLVRLSSLTS